MIVGPGRLVRILQSVGARLGKYQGNGYRRLRGDDMQPTIDIVRGLLADERPPCISLYQPTYRALPDKQQNPIRYKNLLREMRSSLAKKYSAREVKSVVEKF